MREYIVDSVIFDELVSEYGYNKAADLCHRARFIGLGDCDLFMLARQLVGVKASVIYKQSAELGFGEHDSKLVTTKGAELNVVSGFKRHP